MTTTGKGRVGPVIKYPWSIVIMICIFAVVLPAIMHLTVLFVHHDDFSVTPNQQAILIMVTYICLCGLVGLAHLAGKFMHGAFTIEAGNAIIMLPYILLGGVIQLVGTAVLVGVNPIGEWSAFFGDMEIGNQIGV